MVHKNGAFQDRTDEEGGPQIENAPTFAVELVSGQRAVFQLYRRSFNKIAKLSTEKRMDLRPLYYSLTGQQ